jgi:hypothetical protein
MNDRLTLRSVLLWAACGAGLFLGVGAALPVWTDPRVLLVRAVRDDQGNPDVSFEPFRGALWEVVSPRWGGFLAGTSALLAGGSVAGLLGYLAGRMVRPQKGGGA